MFYINWIIIYFFILQILKMSISMQYLVSCVRWKDDAMATLLQHRRQTRNDLEDPLVQELILVIVQTLGKMMVVCIFLIVMIYKFFYFIFFFINC